MSTAERLAVVLSAVLLAAALAAGPVLATEGGGGTEGGQTGETTKIQLPENPHDRVGLILLGLTGLGALVAGANALNQLRGRRPQASGEWRWR